MTAGASAAGHSPLVLQRVVLPTIGLCTVEGMYLHTTGDAWCAHAGREIRMNPGSTVRFDTYFNSFSVGKWRRHTTVRAVDLMISAQGRFELEAVLDHPYRAPRVVAAVEIDSPVQADHSIRGLDLEALSDGLLHLQLRALTPVVVGGGSVRTSQASSREVHLGIVITTFNRHDYLTANLDRLLGAFEDDPELAKHVNVVVVDNGSNVTFEPPAGAPIEVVANRNLGGAGGFARGLMHHRDEGRSTHVLFMDDDIAVDPEVIRRTVAFLAHAARPDTCLAGAMLTEEHPHIQFEAGATFATEAVHPFRSIGGGVDLTQRDKLVANDIERPSGYGAWWYFAFPLASATVNPLPMFVRGDDVAFGLLHTGAHTVTMNGIGVWHQQFAQKNGPAAFYYESRNLPLVSALASDEYAATHLARRFLYQVTRMLFAFKYDSAAAQIAGMRQFLAGPDAWMALDAEVVNQEIRTHQGERATALFPGELGLRAYKPRTQIATRGGGLISALLLGGHLIPKRFSRRGSVALEMSAWSPASVLGREEVLYRYDATGEGFIARRDRRRFADLLGQALRLAPRIRRDLPRLKAEYRAAYPAMTSDEYWHRQFGTNGAAPGAAGSETGEP